jgi:hypothetical protein
MDRNQTKQLMDLTIILFKKSTQSKIKLLLIAQEGIKLQDLILNMQGRNLALIKL